MQKKQNRPSWIPSRFKNIDYWNRINHKDGSYTLKKGSWRIHVHKSMGVWWIDKYGSKTSAEAHTMDTAMARNKKELEKVISDMKREGMGVRPIGKIKSIKTHRKGKVHVKSHLRRINR